MTTNTEQALREALRRIKSEAVSLADAQVLALEALTLPTAAPVDEQGLPPPVATASKGPVAFFLKWTEAGKPLRGSIDLYSADQMRAALQSSADVRDAVLAERESCAKVCESQIETGAHLRCAAAIRARSEGGV